MVTVLTRSSNREHDVGRMPSTNTSDLSETSMSLSGKLLGTPSSGDTLVTVTLGDGNDIDDLVLLEDGRDLNLLLKVGSCEFDLVGDGSTVDLDLHEVGLLLLETGLGELGVAEDSNDGTVLLDSLHLSADGLAVVLTELLGVSGESLLLGSVPVSVESPLELIRKVLGPDGGQRSQSSGSLDVTDNTDDDHRWGLDNGNGLDDFSLVHLGSGSVKVSDDVSHTGLVTHTGGEVDGLLGVILGESLNSTPVSGSSLPGEESKRSRSWLLVLSVRHDKCT